MAEPVAQVQKAEVVSRIAYLVGIEPPPISTGSTEPKEIFLAVNRRLGLGLDERLSKPELARAIVDIASENWSPDYESRGGTVTLRGLEAVLRSVEQLLS